MHHKINNILRLFGLHERKIIPQKLCIMVTRMMPQLMNAPNLQCITLQSLLNYIE